jgi:hypothetical protein
MDDYVLINEYFFHNQLIIEKLHVTSIITFESYDFIYGPIY